MKQIHRLKNFLLEALGNPADVAKPQNILCNEVFHCIFVAQPYYIWVCDHNVWTVIKGTVCIEDYIFSLSFIYQLDITN